MTRDPYKAGTDVVGDGCLHVLLFQDVPGLWVARGLEHDIMVEARTIGEALRAIIRLIEAHTAFDWRHNRVPLSAFRAAPQSCWNAFTSGTTLALATLGVISPEPWQIVAAISHRRLRPAPDQHRAHGDHGVPSESSNYAPRPPRPPC
jgi:hypothetical protein